MLAKHYPSPTFDKNMEKNLKQVYSDKISSDAGPNRAGLFVRASLVAFLAKVERGGDFLKLTTVR